MMDAKEKKISTSILASLALVLLVTGCGKKIYTNKNGVSSTNQEETTKPRPEKLKALKLGEAANFAILAYSNITSNPSSSINGKVGLMPGTHEMITLDPSEVSGGAGEIMGSDDETIPMNLLSNAKVDMVGAYGKAVDLAPDADKIGMFDGQISGKILKPGVYKWNGEVTISNDFSLEGSEEDVWVFKVPAHLNVGSGVHMNLIGGTKAKNVFWQVAGNAVLESNSVFFGTLMAQQFIELKNHATLTGRAFAKNGYISLNQATINRP
ncbi:MAG: ice-binding family protein [Bacteriovorax sp.]